MGPDVRYCKTADGVRIAYTVTGDGAPHLITQDSVVSHVQPEWSQPFLARIFLNAGEPVEDEGDLFGETVIVAARIAAQAGVEEILVPEPVRHLLAGKGFLFAERGGFVPKGFDYALRLHEVRWRE